MDFIRRSFLLRQGTDEMLPDRCLAADDAHPLFGYCFLFGDRKMMNARGNTGVEVSGESPPEDSQLAAAQLHAALRDVPLPTGFMYRLRRFVQHGLEAAE